MKTRSLCKAFLWTAWVALPAPASALSLNLGADYRVRAISAGAKLPTEPKLSFYTQRLQVYMESRLSREVEARVRLQSINPWGVEGTTNTLLQTRYPSANGTPWVQNAYVRVPKLFNRPVELSIGRQPIRWGEGFILDDDELGMNAVRVKARSPWTGVPVDADLFLAKISEGLTGPNRDFGLFGGLLGWGSEQTRRAEFYFLEETDDSGSPYQAGSETAPVTSAHVHRRFMGIRFKGNIRDAYYKIEYVKQSGDADRIGAGDLNLEGSAFSFSAGGATGSPRFGRVNAFVDYSFGSGDAPGDGSKDGAFRPTFAHRWDGLERSGSGRYFAATVSDAFSTAAPFTPAGTTQTGLPAGTSGIQIIGGGIGFSPVAALKGTVAFFDYRARESLASGKALGSEIDFELVYQLTGFLGLRGTYARFSPGDAFGDPRQKATRTELEAQIRF